MWQPVLFLKIVAYLYVSLNFNLSLLYTLRDIKCKHCNLYKINNNLYWYIHDLYSWECLGYTPTPQVNLNKYYDL
jgi:hypothetical protein